MVYLKSHNSGFIFEINWLDIEFILLGIREIEHEDTTQI